MDTSWIDLPRGDPGYFKGCMNFLKLAKETLLPNTREYKCPCNKCKLNKTNSVEEVGGHILFYGFYKNYRNWIFHCKDEGSKTYDLSDDQVNAVGRDDMDGLLRAAFRVNTRQTDKTQDPSFNEQSIEDDNSYDMDEGFTIYREVDDEYQSTFSNEEQSFNKLLELLIDAFPNIKEFPSSYYEGMKIINDLGLGYEKIHACPNDCMLYWGEFANKSECHICHTSRWKNVKGKEGDVNEKGKEACKKGGATKVMRYFPLIPRLKRLYMSSKTVEDMRWHFNRKDDKILRHPADGEAWKKFDEKYIEFAADPRSVILGLASDGFNTYRLMNTNYSTWPVVLIPYNLPPWLCMKPSSFILSIIIPGKFGPDMDIDVYLQPLIHELKLLWEGVDAFDSYSGSNFKLRAALHSTINDFPAYAMLSGWSTKGYKACPSCTHSTNSDRFCGKIIYPGYRKWLPIDHPYRSQANLFDGKEEYGIAPIRTSGTEVLKQQEGVKYVFGKTKKVPKKRGRKAANELDDDCDPDGDDVLWKKRSTFFELEYWEHIPLKHNLDVMHIEKNVSDILLGTLLDMDNSRDDESGREALKNLNIKPHLWINPQGYIPPAAYTMCNKEKE
ncbi:uncharacterized protein LOC110729279 [Chenopodium quinoa]|uniref:uncharacterized protein LOC110729279 n=1 Tax=Chenopodium quinoa TaxID=63459 RepID=UPI000B787D35|nr:uncharacterized protein LOC110729279 [Chenopodium quinoa]